MDLAGILLPGQYLKLASNLIRNCGTGFSLLNLRINIDTCSHVWFFYVGIGDLDTTSVLALCTMPQSPLENLYPCWEGYSIVEQRLCVRYRSWLAAASL